MQTKLTLRLEDELINKAKSLAQKRGKSLSKLVGKYFYFITKDEIDKTVVLPPIAKSLVGSLADSNVDEKDYKDYLEKKHL